LVVCPTSGTFRDQVKASIDAGAGLPNMWFGTYAAQSMALEGLYQGAQDYAGRLGGELSASVQDADEWEQTYYDEFAGNEELTEQLEMSDAGYYADAGCDVSGAVGVASDTVDIFNIGGAIASELVSDAIGRANYLPSVGCAYACYGTKNGRCRAARASRWC
jgi:hypothetical protein